MIENKPWQIRLRGPLGKALERFCVSRLAELDFDKLLEPYRLRTGALCGRDVLLWGECVSCAIQALPYVDGTGDLEEKIRRSVAELLRLQRADGAITAFPDELQLQGLDLPGRRYILKALLRAAAMPGDNGAVKECCIRMCDQIMTLVGPGKRSIIHCGVQGGLDSSAMMDVMTGVYQLTREQRFLDFARYIAESGCSQQHDIFHALRSGMAPSALGNGNAVGLTDCFRGIAALGRADSGYTCSSCELCTAYMERIAAEELFITGSGGGVDPSGTRWCRGAFHQTEADCCGGSMGSTDVTTACLEFFEALSGLLEDPCAPFALAERSFYNALLGAWNSEKLSWDLTGPTPMGSGVKRSAPAGTPLYDLLRGGEALVMAPRMAAQPIENGLVLNFYEELEASLHRRALVRVTGGYPGSTCAHISIRSRQPFTISMRIPEYCTGVYYCDCLLQWKKNSYLTITRPWEPDEVLTLEFDPRVRAVCAPDDSLFQAFMRGPLVLAVDDRGVMVPEKAAEIRHNKLSWVDFASAGKPADSGAGFKVWFRKLLPKYLYHYFDYD